MMKELFEKLNFMNIVAGFFTFIAVIFMKIDIDLNNFFDFFEEDDRVEMYVDKHVEALKVLGDLGKHSEAYRVNFYIIHNGTTVRNFHLMKADKLVEWNREQTDIEEEVNIPMNSYVSYLNTIIADGHLFFEHTQNSEDYLIRSLKEQDGLESVAYYPVYSLKTKDLVGFVSVAYQKHTMLSGSDIKTHKKIISKLEGVLI